MCFRLGSAVGPSAFVRQPSPVSLRSSAFARQPSWPLFPPASPWPSAMVGGVWMVWPWLRSAFGTASGLLWDARSPSARPWRLGFLVSRLAVSVSECKVIASLLPRCAIGCAAVRTRAIMCDEMLWGWKSGLLRRENNLNNLYNYEQPTRFACITILLQGKQQNTTFSISHEQNRARVMPWRERVP